MSDVDVRLSADVREASKAIRGFRKQFADLVAEVEKPLRKINNFRELESSVEATGRQMRTARDSVRDLANELARAQAPSKALQADYRNAVKDLSRLERQEQSQIAQLQRMRREMAAAGIDTRNLAAEQKRLAAEYARRIKEGRADANLGSARKSLGVGQIEATQRALVQLRQQYQLVSKDTTLTAKQRAEAESAYRRTLSQTLEELRKLRAETTAQASKSQQAAAAAAQLQAAARAGIRAQTAELQRAAVAQRQANLEAARSALGVNSARALAAEIARLRGQYELLRTSGNLTGRELAIAQQTLARRIRETQRAMDQLTGSQQRLRSSGNGIGGAGAIAGLGGAYGVTSALRSYIQITDSAKQMDAQLRLNTKTQGEFNKAQEETFRVAQLYAAPLKDVVTLYSRLSPALADIGRGQNDVIGVTQALTAALKISGATTQESSSTLTQFSQALGSGVLRGQEFNSVAESAPVLMRALAKGLNVPTGALRGMAAEGILTAEVITDLTLRALPDLVEQAAKIPLTVEGAFTQLRNEMLTAFGEGDTSALIEAIQKVGDTLSDPKVVEGLINLAAGLLSVAGAAAKAGSEFSDLGSRGAYWAAGIAGNLSELDKVEQKIKDIEKSITAENSSNPLDATLMSLVSTEEELNKELAGALQERTVLLAKIQGITVDTYSDQEKAGVAALEFQESLSEKFEQAETERVNLLSKHRQEISKVRDGLLEDFKKSISAQESAERSAVSASEKIKKDRLSIESKYADAALKLAGGPAGASYLNALDLQQSAKRALSKGDFEGAQKQADAALKMLLELQEAGESTYGLQAMADQLRAIELEANSLEQSKADEKVESIRSKIVTLKDEMKELADFRINLTLDDAQVQAVVDRMKALAAKIGAELTIPVTPEFSSAIEPGSAFTPAPGITNPNSVSLPTVGVGAELRLEEGWDREAREAAGKEPFKVEIEPQSPPPGAVEQIVAGIAGDAVVPAPIRPELDQAAAELARQNVMNLASELQASMVIKVSPQVYQDGSNFSQFPDEEFAGGGWTGPGSKYQPAGVVHADEHVQPKSVVNEPGALSFLERIRRNGFRNTMDSLRGYADGGLVAARSLPAIPAMSPSMGGGQAPMEQLGSLSISLGGETYNVMASNGTAADLKRAAAKFGRTS